MAKRILAVDDDPDLLALTARILKKGGFEVITAGEGRSAIELLQRERFDLVLLDVMMPEVSGFDVSRTLLRDGKGAAVPVVFITAQDDPESMKEGFSAGGTVFLAKPFSAAQLIQVVTSLTSR